MKTTILLVFFVLLVSVFLHHNFLESLLFAVALAVGLTPEFLPMMTPVRNPPYMSLSNMGPSISVSPLVRSLPA